MKTLNIKQENKNFKVYLDNQQYAEVIFENDNKNATLELGNSTLQVVRGLDKNMVLKENDTTIFTFKFDYLWGGAEIISEGVDTGYEIKGRWFKLGTHLINNDNKDLVIVKNEKEGFEVLILEDDISKLMVVATIYYHIYASANKYMSVLMTNVAR